MQRYNAILMLMSLDNYIRIVDGIIQTSRGLYCKEKFLLISELVIKHFQSQLLTARRYHTQPESISEYIYIYIYIYIGMSFSVRGHRWPPRPPVAPSKNGGPLKKRWPLQISTYSFGATKLKVSWSNLIWNKNKTSVYKLNNVINSKRWRMAI